MTRILILGGTSEASALANAVAEGGIDAVFSYAGRTLHPKVQPLPTRVGGFGGASGLAAYLRAEEISGVVDATHPFAVQMSANAVAGCAEAGVPLVAFERPKWVAGDGDDWVHVPDIEAAVRALPTTRSRVFLAIGRQHLTLFADAPQHFYLLRLVDPWPGDLPLPDASAVIGRGPFTGAADQVLMLSHGITHVVAKNSGAQSAAGKLEAARALGLPVIMVDRPAVPDRELRHDVAGVMQWIAHSARRGV
ncbi:cobalt-precorrin-6A reductase [Alphaproteobacteria bacterium KMM 3653]|uniref:Cobalt-precorrin-6A reductase n=1 Tax=Harenicola maris TaxID=2841044 RepID=A0AAP2CMK9_9RHOB|nr:cobalt-precorrin-6A reductase [Harenicola maris]